MLTLEIKEALESVEPANRWMHGYTYSGHPTCCAVAMRNIEIIEREGLLEHSAKMGNILLETLKSALGGHPNVGEFRGGKGLLAAVEFVEDRPTKRNFASDRKIGARLQSEMKHRGVVTRSRAAVGDHPAPGDQILFAPPLIITEQEIDRMVSVLRESVEAVLGS